MAFWHWIGLFSKSASESRMLTNHAADFEDHLFSPLSQHCPRLGYKVQNPFCSKTQIRSAILAHLLNLHSSITDLPNSFPFLPKLPSPPPTLAPHRPKILSSLPNPDPAPSPAVPLTLALSPGSGFSSSFGSFFPSPFNGVRTAGSVFSCLLRSARRWSS